MEPRGDGAGEHVANVVAQVTVKALREFSTGDMENADGVGNHDQGVTRLGNDEVAIFSPGDTQDQLDYYGEDAGSERHGEDSDNSDVDLESNERIVLDPEHPLMKRYQKKLSEILQKRENALQEELKLLQNSVSVKKKEREDVGVELYGIQQELARHQQTLENLQDTLNDVKQQRELNDNELDEARKAYQDRQKQMNLERKKAADLRAELENISLRLFYLENAKKEVHSDIEVMKRAAVKAESEVSQAEETKRKQDLFVSRLVERLDNLRDEVALCDAQMEAQLAETKAAREALSDAKNEIETILVEKKQLFAAWNSALIGMRRRDEAHAAMSEAMNDQKQRAVTLEMEIDAVRRTTQQEQQKNEQLTFLLNKAEGEMATIKKMLSQCQTKYEALKQEFSKYSSILHETEDSLSRTSADRNNVLVQLADLRKEIERCNQEKLRLEDDILNTYRDQLTADKASQFSERTLRDLRERTKDLETQIAKVENDTAKSMLDNTKMRTEIDLLEKRKSALASEMAAKDKMVAKIQAEISKNNSQIKRKTDQMEHLNSKIDKLLLAAGGVELSPLELQCNSLQKSIESENTTITQLQQSWLRDQNLLVQLTKEEDGQSAAVDLMTKQETILIQKKLRVEAEVEMQKAEIVNIQKAIHQLQIDLSKLDSLLYLERGAGNSMQQGNKLLEAQFMGALKDAELESIKLQEKLEDLKEEKERMLNSLVDAERQIMLWEKRTQIAKETKATVDADFGQGEIAAMKGEVHRMQVRYEKLVKEQEKLVQEMEKTVSRREVIAARGDFVTKSTSAKKVTKGALHHQIADLKKKIKQTLADANSCDAEMRELKAQQQQFGVDLDERQIHVQQLQSTLDTLDGDVERLVEQKQIGLTDLLAHQQKTKYYQQVKDQKYARACKTVESLEAEKCRQDDRMNQILGIVDRLCSDYPHAHTSLRRVVSTYGSRAQDCVDMGSAA